MTTIAPAAQALLSVAARAFREGRMRDAVAGYSALLAVEPRLPDSWFNLSIAQRATGDVAGALASLDHALAHGITGAEEAHLNRALILLEDRHDTAGARSALDTALILAPTYVPAWLNLGNLHEDMGDRPAAAEAYARAHALAPEDPLALARLIGVGTASAAPPMLERARRRLRDPELTPLSRADLEFAVAHALDRAGDWDAAFAAAERANAAARQVNAAAGASYDAEAVDALVDRLIALPIADPPRSIPADGPAPVFICGSFRSGTTLVEQRLARTAGLHAAGELPALPAIAARLHPYPASLAEIAPDRSAELRRDYRTAAAPFHPAGARHTDKRPDNVFHVALIRRIFPDARIVCTARDPRDLAVSLWFLHAGPGLAYATDLGAIAHQIRAVARLIAHWRTTYPMAVRVLDYDRLVAAPERELADLRDFVGGGDDVGVTVAAPVRTASQWQVREPLYARSSGRWRHYAPRLAAGGIPVDS